MDTVLVLMSTYNGEKYIVEQIDSILNQKGVLVQLLIRDDGSKDKTVEIIQKYCEKNARVHFYQGENLKPAKSFMDLLQNAPDSTFYAFSDQDDVWDVDKLRIGVSYLKKLDLTKPAMYFSNLKVVDSELNFCRMSHTKSQYQENKYSALVEYMPSGCTMIFNKQLVDMTNLKTPKWCSMHDVWMYLICMFFGSTIYDFEGHISYRQHDNNVMGAYKKKDLDLYIRRIKRVLDRSQQPKFKNALNFYQCYGGYLSEKDKEKVLEIVNYKKSFSNWMKLLFDKELRATTFSRDFRNRLLILFRLF